MHVNSGKHLRILLRALGFKLDGDVCDRLAALLKDMNHIVPRTASQSDQHQLHGTWSRTASLWPESRSKHDLVPTPGLADERAVFNPFDPCLHQRQPSATVPRARSTISNPPLARLAENWHRRTSIRERQEAHLEQPNLKTTPLHALHQEIGSAAESTNGLGLKETCATVGSLPLPKDTSEGASPLGKSALPESSWRRHSIVP